MDDRAKKNLIRINELVSKLKGIKPIKQETKMGALNLVVIENENKENVSYSLLKEINQFELDDKITEGQRVKLINLTCKNLLIKSQVLIKLMRIPIELRELINKHISAELRRSEIRLVASNPRSDIDIMRERCRNKTAR